MLCQSGFKHRLMRYIFIAKRLCFCLAERIVGLFQIKIVPLQGKNFSLWQTIKS